MNAQWFGNGLTSESVLQTFVASEMKMRWDGTGDLATIEHQF
jgi:hypothetical protein